MRNNLGSLNDFLFGQLERLDNEELTEDQLATEINRAKAISSIAAQIISAGNLVLKAQVEYSKTDKMDADAKMPKMLEG
jgi:hypothetical protein